MKPLTIAFGLPILLLPAAAQETPPKHEIGLTLGGLFSSERTAAATRLNLDSGLALQANYGYRFIGRDKAALYGEVHLLSGPLRNVSSDIQTLTRDVATLYVTPGVRLKFRPGSAVAPYVAFGAGWSLYEQSTTTLAGSPNPASRLVNHGVISYGGGVDFKFWRFIGLRAEVRDFYSGSPSYNAPSLRGGQHNVAAGGGLVLRFQ